MNKNITGSFFADNKAPIRILLGAFLFLCGILFMSKIFSIVLKIPGVPYNVRELFLDQGSFFRLSIFSGAILWTGLSASLITGRVAKSRFPILMLPFLIGASGIVSYWMLAGSVTDESISDIVGSSNIWWFVMNKHIWGDWGEVLFQAIGSSELISSIERYVRYLALYCPIVFFMVICSAGFEKAKLKDRALAFFYFSLFSLPWLILSKIIAFDYSSTDNLNELIAMDVAGGWGGGVYLYLLVMLIVFNSVYISKNIGGRFYRHVLMFALTIIAVPVGWYFLKTGLVSNFKKYDVAYSGIDFLLGPDRRNKLPDFVLFLRWSFLYICAVSVLAYGSIVVSAGKLLIADKKSDHPIRHDLSRSVFVKIWWVICFLIAYGSFFPFHFQFDVDQSIRLLNVMFGSNYRSGLSDIVSNIVLFLPFGFAGMRSIGSKRYGFFIVFLFGVLFAFLLQVLQIFTPGRVPSLIDVFWNAAGCFFGIISTYWVKINFFNEQKSGQFQYLSVPIVIASCWLISQLIPFVPSLDFGELKNSLKPLLFYHSFSWSSCLTYVICWVISGSFIFSAYKAQRSKLYFCLVVCTFLCLQIVIMTRSISVTNLLGAFLAMVSWVLFFDKRVQDHRTLLFLVTGLIFINGLFPLTIGDDFNAFQFIPFHGLLSGNMLNNSIKLFEKIFIYGSLVVLLRKFTLNSILVISFGCMWVLLIEVLQIFSTGHTPEITDPLMVLIIAIFVDKIERSKPCTAS
jgi:VanZ family protein